MVKVYFKISNKLINQYEGSTQSVANFNILQSSYKVHNYLSIKLQ
jgi:hypothetical protein